MISAIIYYLISASAVLFYGIGVNKTISYSDTLTSSVITCVKSLFSASATAAISYLMINWLLIPLQLTEIYPFIATMIFILFSTLIEIFISVGIRPSPVDFSIPLLAVILGLGEGFSLSYTVLISCVSIISFYLMIIVFHCVRQRISFYTEEGGLKNYCVLLLCLAVVMIAIYGFNVSWFNLYLEGETR